MKFNHPDGKRILFMHHSTELIGEMLLSDGQWVTIGYLGGGNSLPISCDEWAAFVALVNELDTERSEMMQTAIILGELKYESDT